MVSIYIIKLPVFIAFNTQSNVLKHTAGYKCLLLIGRHKLRKR